jgi:hypothetical protein
MFTVYAMHASNTKEVEMKFTTAEIALAQLGLCGRGIETVKDSAGITHRIDLGRGFSAKKGEVIRKVSLAAELFKRAS